MPSTSRRRTTLRTPTPFELRLCLFGHGWIALPPHDYDERTATWHTALRLGRAVVDASVSAGKKDGLQLALRSRRPLSSAQVDAARRQVRHMMRLDCDLSAFHRRCLKAPAHRWIGRRGAGRLLRSAMVFEDLMKLLFTTNTSWSATEAMTRNLVDALGERAPSGRRAFPTPKQCLQDEAFYRDVVRCGYRAGAARALAEGFVTGELHDDLFLREADGEVLWRRLCDLRGFGPYAAGQAMRLCGHYERLAIDSWCRAKLRERDGTDQPPTDAAIEREYAPWAPFQGLALWCELTADWHV